MKQFIVTLFFSAVYLSLPAQQKEYKASTFGIKSDGYTLNTSSIQKAIDYISENGGGQLTFWVGRYRTGTIHLKSNVTIEIREGAALMASPSPYDYDHVDGQAALIIAQDQQHIRIFGKGLIDGVGLIVNQHIDQQTTKGNLPEGRESFRPAIIYMNNCSGIAIEGIILQNAGGNVQEFVNCKDVRLSGLTVKSKVIPETKGIVLDGCNRFLLHDSYLDTSSTPVQFGRRKSKQVKLENNVTADNKNIDVRNEL